LRPYRDPPSDSVGLDTPLRGYSTSMGGRTIPFRFMLIE